MLATNAGTGAQAQHTVHLGGKYRLRAVATFGGGSVALQTLGPDGTTWIPVANASLTAAGDVEVNLPKGQYRVLNTTATAVYADLVRVTF